MVSLINPTQSQFHREFLMGRGNFNPADFGVDMPRDEFGDQMVDAFHNVYRTDWTIDELLLHPVEALQFCNGVRRLYGYYDVPDDIILRSVLNRRKQS